MATVFRVGGHRVVVFSNDHGPPHVHAIGDGHARFAPGRAPAEVRLNEQDGIVPRDLRRIAKAIAVRHAECVEAWKAIHGKRKDNGKRP